MLDVEIVNANATEYWENIKRRTSIRNANKLVESGVKRLRVSMIYEQYVRDLIEVVLDAAVATGVPNYKSDMDAFLADWSIRLGEPSIARDHREVRHQSRMAVAEVQRCMMGED